MYFTPYVRCLAPNLLIIIVTWGVVTSLSHLDPCGMAAEGFVKRRHSMYYRLELGATCAICNVLNSWLRGQKNEQQNNSPNPEKNNAALGYLQVIFESALV